MFKLVQIAFCIFISIPAVAQTIKEKKEKARVGDEYAVGFEVDIDGTFEEAELALQKQMRSFGKMRSVENFFAVAEPTIQDTAYLYPVYGMVKQVGNLISVWIGIKEKEWKDRDAEIVNNDLGQILHSFGVSFHRDKIQKQIDESLRASQAVDRQQQKLINENRSLTNKVENNKQEKIQLERSIENNKLELANLLKRLEKNKKDQDSVQVAGEQIRKVVEMHQERQRKVN